MITIALAHLLDRGVQLDVAEAVAIAQAVAPAPGEATVGNIGLRTDGTVMCTPSAGQATAAGLARLIDALLPQAGVPAALRYAVARGAGAVEAPPFSSVEAFSAALSRFEQGDRAEIVRRLLARATGAPRSVAAVREPAGEVILRPAPVVPPPVRRRSRVPAVAAALLASAIAGFASARYMRASLPVAWPQPSAVSRSERGTPPPFAAPSPPPAATDESARSAPRRGGSTRALAIVEAPAFSPAFSPSGTALFFQTGGPGDASSAIAVATADRWPSADLRIMTVVDDGSRNYHAQPSPDGRFIAFDSDRDGERGIYLADHDGTHVRRVSGPGYAALPTWAPDGARLAYVRAEAGRPSVWNLWLQPIDGSAPRRLTAYRAGQTWSASWFPDNRRIAYSHEDALTILDLLSGERQQYRSPVTGRLLRTPAVSPDGSKIVFQVFRAGAWMLDLADGSMQCVLADPTAEEFAWAPDGRRLAFHSRRDGEWGVYVMPRG
jgi:hypothetical protein